MLEVIDKGSATEAHRVPLLFVHGAWHGAWCWDEHFLDFFADKGFRALAVSLRGHGGSSASKPIRFHSLADYVEGIAGEDAEGFVFRGVVNHVLADKFQMAVYVAAAGKTDIGHPRLG